MNSVHRKRFQAVATLLVAWAYTRREQRRLLAAAVKVPPVPDEGDVLDRLTPYQRWMAKRADKLAHALWRQVGELARLGVASLATDLSRVQGWPADTSTWATLTRRFLAFGADLAEHEGRDLAAELTAVQAALDTTLATFNLQTDSTTRITDALGP